MSAAWLLCGLHSACVGGIDLSGAATDLAAPVASVSAEAGPSAMGCRGQFPRAVGGLISLPSGWSESISCSRASRRSSCACPNSSLDDRGGSASMARANCSGPVNSRRPRGAGGKKAGQRVLPFSAKRSSTFRLDGCTAMDELRRSAGPSRRTAPYVTEQSLRRAGRAAAPGVKRQRPVSRAGKRVIGHERPALRVPRGSRA